MTGSVADLIESVHSRTGFTRTYVAQRARNLQVGGRLRVTAGAKQPRATPRDCVNLLFALTADKARHAPQAVSDFEGLSRLVECEPEERRAGDAIERLIAKLWAGNRCETRSVITLWRHPTPQIDVADSNGHARRFHPAGHVMETKGSIDVRVGLHVPGLVLAGVGYDLGFKGCAYAA